MERRFDTIPKDDALPALREIMDWLRANPGATARIPAGEYRISTELSRATQAAVMRGEYGENPENTMFAREFPYETGLRFDGQRGTTLLAEGATFWIDGFMEPISISRCEGVTLSGVTIDYVRRPFSRGTVEEAELSGGERGEGFVTVRFAPEYPVNERTPMPRLCVYDPALGRFDLSLRARDSRYLGDNRVRFECLGARESLVGCEFTVWHCFHYRPAIRIEQAKDITVRDVTIHSHCGMGIVGHRSENVLLSGLRVVPAPGEHMSTNTDATHFTSCSGLIRFERCFFEGHGDDATNVHTFYHEFERLSPHRARAWVKVRIHSATQDWFDAGERVELVSARTLAPAGIWRVLESAPDSDANCCYLTFDTPLPEDAGGYLLISADRRPRLEFADCRVRNHWARAVLIKTREALVENCVFETSALWAIHVAAEAGWFEGSHSDSVIIRGNAFRACGHATRAPRRIGGVNVEMDVREHDGCQHGTIEIRDNRFDLPEMDCAVSVSDAKRVILAGNRYDTLGDPVRIENCESVETDG